MHRGLPFKQSSKPTCPPFLIQVIVDALLRVFGAAPPLVIRMVFLHNLPHLLLVGWSILFEEIVGFGLRGGLRVWIIEKILDSKENLLDSDRGFPCLFFIQNRKADGARRVDVGVEERGDEFA